MMTSVAVLTASFTRALGGSVSVTSTLKAQTTFSQNLLSIGNRCRFEALGGSVSLVFAIYAPT